MGKKKSTVQDALMLTDKGYRDLKKAIAACTLTNFSMFIPARSVLLLFPIPAGASHGQICGFISDSASSAQ